MRCWSMPTPSSSATRRPSRSEEHTSELQSLRHLVCRLLLEKKKRYPVLYLHDGQNVFSSAGTNVCFGWGNWEVDKTVDVLCRARKLQHIILVIIDHTAARYA